MVAVAWPMVAAGLVHVVVGGVYAYVGRHVRGRPAPDESRLARDAFAAWWVGLALLNLQAGLVQIVAALGLRALAPYQALFQLRIVVLCAALGALMYYLTYLVSGSRRSWIPVALLYTANFLLAQYFLATHPWTGLEVGNWIVRLSFAQPLGLGDRLYVALVAGLLGPVLVGAVAYFTLVFLTPDRAARYRILMVSSSLTLWFLLTVTAAARSWTTQEWWVPASLLMGLTSALLILAAYRPPRWISARLNTEAPSAGAAVPAAPPSPGR